MINKNLWLLMNGLLMISLTIVACGPTAPAVSTATTQMTLEPVASSTAKGTVNGIFNVNGHSLYLACLGTGSPTIVLETGEGGTVSDVSNFQKLLAKQTTTCAYDRADTGGLRTAKDIIDDLHALLTIAQVPGPYLLVGQSAGGLFVQLYARTFPDQVVGVVAMNPVTPAHPWLDEVRKLFTTQQYSDERTYYQGQNGGPFDYLISSEQLTAAPKPPAVPFEMLISTNVQCADDSTGGCMKSYPNYERIMKEVTAAWPHGNLSEVPASHEIYHDDPDAVIAIVKRMLTSH